MSVFCINCKHYKNDENVKLSGTLLEHKCYGTGKVNYITGKPDYALCSEVNTDGKCEYYKEKK